MPSRNLILLAIITLFAFGACWDAIDQRYSVTDVKLQKGGPVFPNLDYKDATINSIEISRANGSFTLSRQIKGWTNNELGNFPVNSKRVENAIIALASLKYLEHKTMRNSLYYKLGVEDVDANSESTRLTLKTKNNKTLADVIVGKSKETRSPRPDLYIRLAGDERAWLVEGMLDVHHDSIDWTDRQVIDIAADRVKTVTVHHADGEVMSLRRDKNLNMKLTENNIDLEVEHQYQIDYMVSLLEGVRFDDVQLSKTNNNNAPIPIEVQLLTNDHLKISIAADRPESDGSAWITISASVNDDHPEADNARQEADLINTKFNGWRVRLPRKFMDRLKIRLTDIVGTGITKNEKTQ